MNKERIKEGFRLFSAEERAVISDALDVGDTSVEDLVLRLCLARRRADQRWRSDMTTDQARRLLVGARVPRETAERYRRCAGEEGLSLYRFVCNALEREYKRLQDKGKGSIM